VADVVSMHRRLYSEKYVINRADIIAVLLPLEISAFGQKSIK